MTISMTISIDHRQWLRDRFGRRVQFDEPMARHTTFRVGGPAEAFVRPQSAAEIRMLINGAAQRGIPWAIVGGGSNLLVKDGGITGIVIALTPYFKEISLVLRESRQATVSAQAGAGTQALCRFAIERGLQGMNFALGIPGTVGGAVVMNAGTAAGWMQTVVKKIRVLLPGGEDRTVDPKGLNWAYRRLELDPAIYDRSSGPMVILEAFLGLVPADPARLKAEADALLAARNSRQPTRLPNAGCVFKNPAGGVSAGELIDRAGLKGTRVGGAEISTKHANFIVNTGHARAADILELMTRVQAAVGERFQVGLEPEVVVVGKEINGQESV